MALITSVAKIAQPLWGELRGLKVSETLAGSLKDSFCEGALINEEDSDALINIFCLSWMATNGGDVLLHFIH